MIGKLLQNFKEAAKMYLLDEKTAFQGNKVLMIFVETKPIKSDYSNSSRLSSQICVQTRHKMCYIRFKIIDCIDLQTGKRREEFECRHKEADMILFYIYCQLRKS